MRRSRRKKERRGLILAIVLVGVLVVTLFGAAVARSLIAQRQHTRQLERQQQAFWLAESGLQRARRALANDPAFAGEQLRIESVESGLPEASLLSITIHDAKEPAAGRLISVEAIYPADSTRRAVHRRDLTIAAASAEEN